MLRYDYILGTLTGFAFGCVMAAMYWPGDSALNKGVEPPRFEVVDQYKECDVVRYTPQNHADYVFFLDCSKDK